MSSPQLPGKEGLIMRTLIAADSVPVRVQLEDGLRRLVPRLLGIVFLTILCVVALSRCAVFSSLVYLMF